MTGKRIVLTGGPHAGKTTTLAEINKRGYPIVEESAILVIEALHKTLGDYEARMWRESHYSAFQALIGHRQRDIEEKLEVKDKIFLDRGRIDNVAFGEYFDHPTSMENKILADTAQYDQVFLLELIEPFKERQESGRIEDRRMAVGLQEQLFETYTRYGFDVVRVPQMQVDKRVDFILNRC